MSVRPLLLLLPLLALACGGTSGMAGPGAQPPVAQVGSDQAVASGVTVTLDGRASSDPTGMALSYAWAQTAGPAVTLSSPTAAVTSFAAPVVPAGQPHAVLAFSLTVSSPNGTSAPAAVAVTVSPAAPANPPPVARAGPDQAVASGTSAALDGSASSDADGQALSYAWTQVSGPAVTLAGAATAHPTFTAPTVAAASPPATCVFSLVVSDPDATSAPATVTVTVNPAGSTAPAPPGTPAPAAAGTVVLPTGGSGSGRWQIGAASGLYVVDPAVVSTTTGLQQEPTVQGLVNVTLGSPSSGSFIPPPDTVVTLNGVALLRDPTLNGAYFRVDETKPLAEQPHPGSGGQIVLVATATSGGKLLQRTLVLPCPADVAVASTPQVGGVLTPATPPAPLVITSATDVYVNYGLPIDAILDKPTARLWGYEPSARALVPIPGSSPALETTPGPLHLEPLVLATTAPAYLVDLRWPGPWVIDGQTGGFCGLVKRWTYAK